jgi:hypothetical protein
MGNANTTPEQRQQSLRPKWHNIDGQRAILRMGLVPPLPCRMDLEVVLSRREFLSTRGHNVEVRSLIRGHRRAFWTIILLPNRFKLFRSGSQMQDTKCPVAKPGALGEITKVRNRNDQSIGEPS